LDAVRQPRTAGQKFRIKSVVQYFNSPLSTETYALKNTQASRKPDDDYLKGLEAQVESLTNQNMQLTKDLADTKAQLQSALQSLQ
jgi:hypothetical protein